MSAAIARLKAIYEEEQRAAAPPRTRHDLPLSYEAITDEWLTDVVCREHPDARVVRHRLGAANEGNTSRRRIFLEYNEAGRSASLPSSLFCKASHQLASRVSTGLCGGIECEVTFYNHLRPLLSIEAPRAVWAKLNPTTLNSIILLHDMSDSAEFCTLSTSMTEDRLRGQMKLLARLHAHSSRPDMATRLRRLPKWPDFFARLSLIGIEQLCKAGFEAAREVIPQSVFARAHDIWPATIEAVRRHDALPSTLIHCDVHLRNWYVTSAGAMGLSDWQCATRGHWSRDVAYAMTTAMDVSTRRRLGKDLLHYYLEQLRLEGGPQIEFEEAWEHYRKELLPALAWWTITMPSKDLPAMQPVDVTLEMIRRITCAIEDADALGSF